MAENPNCPPFPKRTAGESLEQFLTAIDEDPNLAHFRAVVRSGPERQLALFAALERSVVVGSPAVSPPPAAMKPINSCATSSTALTAHPELKNHGSAYGPYRHLANLQALGVWRGSAPLSQPSARELFATTFSHLTACQPSDSTSSIPNNSPPSLVFSPNGELISSQEAAAEHSARLVNVAASH